MNIDRKLNPELSFEEVALIIAALRESKSPSAKALSKKLYTWATQIIDAEAKLHKMILDIPTKDRA